jgi:hypothetical protein
MVEGHRAVPVGWNGSANGMDGEDNQLHVPATTATATTTATDSWPVEELWPSRSVVRSSDDDDDDDSAHIADSDDDDDDDDAGEEDVEHGCQESKL